MKLAVWLGVVLLSAILLFSAYKLVRIFKSYRDSAKQYKQISEIAIATISPSPSISPNAVAAIAPSEVPVTVDWAALKAINADVVGWLYCANTPVNYPVVQTNDNDYYLTHGFDGNKSSSGALFLDCRNNIAALDENFIIYGHRMKDDSMFGTIPQYAEQAYYDEHPIMYFLTPEQNYRVELFACRTVHSKEKYFETYFENKIEFKRYLNKAIDQSYLQTDVTVDPQYPSLTLVTCSTYANTDSPRLLVHGCLVQIF